MSGTNLKIALQAVAIILAALLVIRCGGGGNGGDAVDSSSTRVLQPLSYTGVMTPVAISLVNAPTLVTNVLYGGAASETEIPSAVATAETTVPDNSAIGADRLIDIFQPGLEDIFGDATHGYTIPTAVDYNNETEDCESGYYIVNGSVDDWTGIGTLTFDFYNCFDDGVTLDGMVHFTVHALDYYQFNFTMDYVLMTIISSELNGTVSGTVRSDNSYSGYAITMRDTMNCVERYNDPDNKMYKYENFVRTVVDYDYSGGSIGYSGTPAAIMYDSHHGRYSVETPTALEFSSDYLPNPDLDGQLVLTGDQSAVSLTVESVRHFKLELDLDGAAGYEVLRYVLWSELDSIGTLNLTDSDNDGMHDSWEGTFGLDPNGDDADEDPDLDGLTNLQEYQQGYDPTNEFSPPA